MSGLGCGFVGWRAGATAGVPVAFSGTPFQCIKPAHQCASMPNISAIALLTRICASSSPCSRSPTPTESGRARSRTAVQVFSQGIFATQRTVSIAQRNLMNTIRAHNFPRNIS